MNFFCHFSFAHRVGGTATLSLAALAQGLSAQENATVTVLAEAEPMAEIAEVEGDEQGVGILLGRVVDVDSGELIPSATILVDGRDDLIGISDSSGAFVIQNVPAGTRNLIATKAGYLTSRIENVIVQADTENQSNVVMRPQPTETAEQSVVLDTFVIEATEVDSTLANLELRFAELSVSDLLSREDFSRFIASDVGDILKRIPGVVVEGGQFAVIRGLDERYSSTLLNGAPLPSPDPDRQSVPLDLFPSDVVSNLQVIKTFSADLPGNSSAGSINILTDGVPDELSIDIGYKIGFSENALLDTFLKASQGRQDFDFDTDAPPSSFDPFRGVPEESDAPLEFDLSTEAAGILPGLPIDVSVRVAFAHELDAETRLGSEYDRGVDNGGDRIFDKPYFDLTSSTLSERDTMLIALASDLDEDGDHHVGYNFFWTKTTEDLAALREGRYLDNSGGTFADQFNGASIANLTNDLLNGIVDGGFTSVTSPNPFAEKLKTVEATLAGTERQLFTHQIAGNHIIEEIIPGKLEISYAGSIAEASQTENDAFNGRVFLLPAIPADSIDGTEFGGFGPGGIILIPTTGPDTDFEGGFLAEALAGSSGAPVATVGWREVEEQQYFGRVDVDYELEISEDLTVRPFAGGSYEDTERTVDNYFLLLTYPTSTLSSFTNIVNATQSDLSGAFQRLNVNPSSNPGSSSESTREITAFYLGTEATFLDQIDLNLGVRYEDIQMNTVTNSPAGNIFFNYDLLTHENPSDPNTVAANNVNVLGIADEPLPLGYQGEIDQQKLLPAAVLAYRPFEGARAILAYSETVVRPSFKEFTYVTTRDPQTGDYESGNPTLTTSDVRSLDFRTEYTWNDGDLVAFGAFYKRIEDPIERIQLLGSDNTVLTQTYFNNPNEAEVYGVEGEFRKRFTFTPIEVLDYFSVGANAAFIEAKVDRLRISNLDAEFTDSSGEYQLSSERRLVGQPEWIVNADVSFEHPDWGTSLTLSYFAQSDVLRSAAGYGLSNNTASSDQYNMAYHELNLAFSQRFLDYFKFTFSVKNLTDSERGIEYDDELISGEPRQEYKVGREYTFGLSASF